MSSDAVVRCYRFGQFELEPRERRLLNDGQPVPIGARAFDVLVTLVARSGDLVSKEALLESAWAGLVVEENNLQVQVSALRKVLGPQAIATVPGRGYRFAAPVTSADSASPSASTATEPSGNRLPTPSSDSPPIYGRDEDLVALRKMIGRHALVTIVGSAGIGKTCLAEAVAREAAGAFPDGMRFVQFAQLADPALVPVTISRALGLAGGDPDSARELAVQALAGRRLLLVLDNCEHLLDAVDRVVCALRRDASGVHVLLTSQELLRHAEERVYRIGPLALPADSTLSGARAAGATELFIARVQSADPRFALSEANVGALIDICRRLDGIPLALELAAARVPLLGVEGVRERLDERFRLLTAGARLALPRHQTLRAAFEWSYGLLSEPERIVFDRLGVFAGGFSLEAAQRLSADDSIDEWAVLDHLGALVDKSLVLVEHAKVPRYRMLETTRAFALERLASCGDTPRVMRRHAEVMQALFERYWIDLLRDVSAPALLAQVAPDLDNLRGALRWATEGDHRTGIALIGAAGAGYYLDWMQLSAEGWRWCRTFKPLVEESVPASDAARFWLACAELGTETSLEESICDAQRAVAMYREAADPRGQYQAWNALLYSLTLAGRLDEAQRAFEEARKWLDPAWPARFRAMLANRAGMLFSEADQEDKARECLTEQLALSRQTENPTGESSALGLLVDLEVQLGHPERAVDTARQIAASNRANAGFDIALVMRNCATALMAAGLLDEAEAIYREALSAARRNYGTGAFVLDDIATLVAHAGRIDDAARLSAYAQHVYARVGRRPRLVARRNRERLLTLLSSERSADALATLFDEGRRLTEEEACALAFPANIETPGAVTGVS